LEVDSEGRITLPKSIRDAAGIRGRVLSIDAGDHLKVIPLPSNPVEALDGILDLKKPFRELRKGAEDLAAKSARGRLSQG
jgi:bifunctional DNA-binding transcriptional regulator/antitoxin component of YhaV-PrlF toxin-antitoxin module